MPRSSARRSAPAGARAAPEPSLAGTAYERVKQAVIECELPPGAVVSQEELMFRFGLTRAAVRAALARLEQEELLKPLPRRGYRVAPITLRDFEEVFTVRALIGPAVTCMAAGRLTADAHRRLAKLAAVGFRRGDRDSGRRFLQANREFHLIIASHSGNARLLRLMEQVLDEFLRMTWLTMAFGDDSEEWTAGHRDILDAVARGDGARAERLVRTEIDRARTAMRRAVLDHHVVSSVNLG